MGGSLEAFRVYLDTFKVRDEPREVKESTYSSFYQDKTSSEPGKPVAGKDGKVQAEKSGEVKDKVVTGEDSGYESSGNGAAVAKQE